MAAPTILLNFSNNEKEALNSLRSEDDAIYGYLQDHVKSQAFLLVKDQYATTEKVVSSINIHRNDLVMFWFSGHAGRDQLIFEDAPARAQGVANLLGQCRDLALVGLNGCSTKYQVEALLEQGVPIVIASSAPIGDSKAAKFAGYFFQELSQYRSIREAFSRAVSNISIWEKAQHQVLTYRNWSELNKPLADGDYLLCYNERGASLLDSWRLPTKPMQQTDTEANKYIRSALENIGSKYIKNEDKVGQRNAALEKLPFMIGDPIRRLLAPSENEPNQERFYDKSSSQRYDMLLFAYQNLLGFLCYTILGQLWRNKAKLNKSVTLDFEADFLQWLTGNYQHNKQQFLVDLFERLAKLTIKLEVPFFIQGLERSIELLADAKIKEQFSFINNQLLNSKDLSPATKMQCCSDLERRLATILLLFKNLVGYSLISIKEIGVLNYMHNSVPIYDHKIVRVQISNTGIDEVNQKIPNYLKTAAILLNNEENQGLDQGLFLSPFLIDINAYFRSPKAKLLAFDHYDRQTKTFYYRDASRISSELTRLEAPSDHESDSYYDPHEEVEKEINSSKDLSADHYSLIYEQFSAFTKDIFGKKLDEL